MKLNIETPYIELAPDMQEKMFSIGDATFIFDILRNKMYSDPILAIAREISCNARDAHREVGKFNLPIEITLPSHLEPFYKIKDWGPGISADRMENVFIKYGVSTKREDNIQVGCFGIGAKVPFSYSDTFTITTIVNNIKYDYACFIDETKVGKLILMGQEPSTEINSTEIVIPVKPTDFNKFIVATEQSTRHWGIKPIINGGVINWTQYDSSISGSGWKIAITKHGRDQYNSYNNSYYNNSVNYDRGIKVLVDGIEYHVSMEALKKFASSEIVDACKGFLFLYFDIGELSLSANRESVYIDKATEAKIISRLDVVKAEIAKTVNDKIASYETYFEANTYFQKELKTMFNSLEFLGELKWNDIKLYGPLLHLKEAAVIEFYKGKSKIRGRSFQGSVEKIRTKTHAAITLLGHAEQGINYNTAIFYNDLGIENLTYKHVKSAFESGSTSVQVITAYPGVKTQIVDYETLDKEYPLTGIGCKMLSSITNAAVKNRAVSAAKLLVFKVRGSNQYSTDFEQVPYSTVEEDTNAIKVLCFFDRSDNTYGKQYKELYLNSVKVGYAVANSIISEFRTGVSFYAIQKDTDPERIKKDFGGFITLDEFINEKIVNSKIDYVGIKAVGDTYIGENIDFFNKMEDQIQDPNSIFLKRIKCAQYVSNLRNKKHLIRLYESVVKPIADVEVKNWLVANKDYNYSTIKRKCDEKYPLISDHTFYHSIKAEHVSQYINFIDTLKEE